MKIKNIHSNNFSKKDIQKSDQSHSVSGKKFSKAPRTSAGTEVAGGDKISLSGSQFNGDVEFAKNVMDNLNSGSFTSLRKIKRKIEQGDYNTEEVHKKIETLIKKDLTSSEQIIFSLPEENQPVSGSKNLSPEYRKYLVENPKVVQKIADKVAADLNKI